ncbi:dihydroorotate dehydrogenase electron transfer subunit [Planctomicrobium piriforme]|uniref:Dihydroorotate dehydrogenase electron transfer subunit n=1 Tax=Planctomicrobium piriforme TaxID=1576369 RepID=A0A1I3CDD6_9PLAN|nr:dihydroorotate dehydrogenase electron transfer subunit [Planctomicrobium piriforme]SFH72507.1 dihydroorotate dehydrogenase electron transfer subunit [Planctomicrobium piriforme]
MIQPATQHDLCGLMPHASQYRAVVLEQRELADHTYAIRIGSPELARLIQPGQFFMIRPERGTDPLLGRPFALYDTILNDQGEPIAFEFAYHVIGKLTGLMSHWEPGTAVEIWGPLGNGFPLFRGQHLLCVGGGIGYTPFLAVAREALRLRQYGQSAKRYDALSSSVPSVSLCYGVQSKKFRADLSDFEPLTDLSISIATDDGSEGRPGFVTALVEEKLAATTNRPDAVYCCGPEPMMHAVARLCRAANVDCWLSLESPMACGFGACFSCVTKVRDAESPEGWDYRRTCVEGPIFRADQLVIE